MLNSQPTGDVTIAIASSNTTEGTVSAASLTFTAANWNVAQIVTVTGADDAIDDGDVAYSIVTGAAVSTDAGYNGMAVDDVALTNVDNDSAGISVSTISRNTTEAGGTATFSVMLTSQPTADVTISLASSNTAEGAASVASLTFSAANWNVAQVVTVTGVDDSVDDGNIAYTIVTGAAVSADGHYSGIDAADVAATNVDNDSAGITVSAISGSTSEAGGSATFSVVLDSQPTADVTISIASGDAAEGSVSASALTFTAANWNTAQVVTVTGADDAIDDGDVGYSIVTGAATSADGNYSGIGAADVAVVNIDNDTAGVVVAPISGSTSEAGGSATFSVVLASQPTADVTISLASSNAAEGNASVTSLTFTAANWNVGQVVSVTGVDDAIDDGDVSYSIVTAAAISADANYAGLDAADVAVSNIDNDTAGVAVSAISGNTTEAGGTASFSVALTSPPTADVTISLTSSDAAEGTPSVSSLTFTASNWNVAQVVMVTGADDAMVDGDTAYSIVTGAAVSADANYNGLNAADVGLTNGDNDTAGVSVSAINGSTTEAGGTATFGVVLTSQPSADVTITIASNDTTEGTASISSLTFTAANWNVAQVVSVTGVDDARVDGDVAYSIVTSAAASADANYSSIAVNDVALANVDDERAPMLGLPASLDVNEDTSLRLGAGGLSVTDPNGDLARIDLAVTHGSLTVDLSGGASIIAASAGNRGVGIVGTQVQLIDALARTTYRGDADWSGPDMLSISAADTSGLQTGGSVAIHVSPLNDAPVITSAHHVDIPEGQVAVTRVTSSDVEADVPHYAIVGGADAARFVIDNDSGELRWRDAPDAEAPTDSDRDNVYEVTVEVSDGQGGTARQGLDVTVLGVNEAPSVSVTGLSVPVDGAVTLTPRQIVAHDVDSPAASLTYSVTGVVNGHFELATQPGTAISTFSQSALEAGLVSFVHDAGTPAPQFVITVSDGQANSAPLSVQATISSGNPTPAPHTGTPDNAPPPEPAPTVESASPPARSAMATPSASRTETPDLPHPVSHADDSTGAEPGADSSRKPFIAPSSEAASHGDDRDDVLWRGEESRRAMLLALFDDADSRGAKELEASDTPRLALAHQPEEDAAHLELGAIVLQTLGIALTAGSVWWALRATGLLTALLASLPAWRQLDFLPVLAEEEDDDAPRWSPAEDAEAARDEAAVERDLFAEGVHR